MGQTDYNISLLYTVQTLQLDLWSTFTPGGISVIDRCICDYDMQNHTHILNAGVPVSVYQRALDHVSLLRDAGHALEEAFDRHMPTPDISSEGGGAQLLHNWNNS